MTKIIIHGFLGKIFGKEYNLYVSNVVEAIKAIDANKKGFFKKIKELEDKKFYYTFIVDGEWIEDSQLLNLKKKIKEIHLVPTIVGAAAAAIFTVVAAAVTATSMTAFVVTAVIGLALLYVSTQIAKSMNSTPNTGGTGPGAGQMAAGGSVAFAQGGGKSYIFNNRSNTIAQGSIVPIGYGRLRLGSKVILNSVKNYNQSIVYDNEVSSNLVDNSLNNFGAI